MSAAETSNAAVPVFCTSTVLVSACVPQSTRPKSSFPGLVRTTPLVPRPFSASGWMGAPHTAPLVVTVAEEVSIDDWLGENRYDAEASCPGSR